MPAHTLTSKVRPPEGAMRAEGACTQAALDSSTSLSSILRRVLTASASCHRPTPARFCMADGGSRQLHRHWAALASLRCWSLDAEDSYHNNRSREPAHPVCLAGGQCCSVLARGLCRTAIIFHFHLQEDHAMSRSSMEVLACLPLQRWVSSLLNQHLYKHESLCMMCSSEQHHKALPQIVPSPHR